MPDRKPSVRRRRIPYLLIAAVFVPLVAAYTLILLNLERFRFWHPRVLALISPAGVLVLWMDLVRSTPRRWVSPLLSAPRHMDHSRSEILRPVSCYLPHRSFPPGLLYGFHSQSP